MQTTQDANYSITGALIKIPHDANYSTALELLEELTL